MKALKNMAIAAIIALVLGFPLQVAAQNTTTDTLIPTGIIDGFRFVENIKIRNQNQKAYGKLVVATDSLFLVPITLSYDTLAGGTNSTKSDTLSGSMFQGPKWIYFKRTWIDSLGVHTFIYKVRTIAIPPVVNYITAPTQVVGNKLICSWSAYSRDTAYIQRYYSPDGNKWFQFGTLDKLNPGSTIKTDSIVGVNLTGDSIQYYVYNLGGGDSTIRSKVTNYTPGLPWGDVDSAMQITNTKNIKFSGRCIPNNSITVGKLVLGIGDTLTFTLPASGSVQNWTVTKIGATPGVTYTPVVIFKNAVGSYVSTKYLQITIHADLNITGVVVTTSTASANFKFTPSVPVYPANLFATFILDINKGDSSFLSPIASKQFDSLTTSSQQQEATLTGMDTGMYYARIQGYILSTGQTVKVIVPFEIKAVPVTGIMEFNKSKILYVYPNPVQDILNLPESTFYTINDIQGRFITSGNSDKVDMSNIPNGMYIIRTESGYARIEKN